MPFHYALKLRCGHLMKASKQYGKTVGFGSKVWCTPCKKEEFVILKLVDER